MTPNETAPTRETDLGAARQKGRGREAQDAFQFRGRALKEIIGRVFASIGRNRVMLIAAGVTFYLLLALVPSLTAFVTIYGLVADQSAVVDHLNLLSGVIPGGGLVIIEDQLQRLVAQEVGALSWALVISVALALWSASTGIKALFKAMNIAYGERETRGFIKISALGLSFTLVIAVGAALALGAVVIIPAMMAILPLGDALEWLIQIGGYLVLVCALMVGIAALYRFGPSRAYAKWRWVTPGAGFALVLILVASVLFSWYVANFGDYNATYGSLGALIGFLTWIWISVALLILGAEINAEMERQTARDTTIGGERPMGQRGAYVADTVG